jgi:hypothetical protein
MKLLDPEVACLKHIATKAELKQKTYYLKSTSETAQPISISRT